MKKTLPAAIFIIALLIMSLIPTVGMIIYGPSEAGANEVQSSMPVFRDDEGAVNTDYLSGISTYVSDHYHLRQEIINAHNTLVSAVFNVSPEDDVILGSNGWLYYSPTLDDYTGADAMTRREVFSAAHNLLLMQEYANERGADFLFAVSPNKNSVYPENMPDYGSVSVNRDAQKIFDYLNESGVKYADLFTLFGEQEEILYFEHDSHWNSKGAAMAADELNSLFGISSDYFSDAFPETEAHTGDLFEMLYPTGADSEENYVYGGELTLSYENSNVRPDSITINVSGLGNKNLLAYRDSFGNLLYPYLADSFAWSRFSRSTTYDLTAIESLEIDCVLIEIVERNLDYLITYAPVIVSPVRDIEIPDTYYGYEYAAFDEGARAPDGFVAFKGTVSVYGDIDEESPVYVICGGKVYDALLMSGNAFTAYIPESDADGGCAVAYYADGELVFRSAKSE